MVIIRPEKDLNHLNFYLPVFVCLHLNSYIMLQAKTQVLKQPKEFGTEYADVLIGAKQSCSLKA